MPLPSTLLSDLEAEATRVETPCGDGAMVWRKWGSGPALLLLHGANGSWTHWIRNIPTFMGRFSVWVPDLPGFGESAVPARPQDGALDGDCIAEAIAAGIRSLLPTEAPLDVVGFSLGGVLATHLAAVAPDLVRRVILVATGGLDTPLGAVEMVPLRGLTDRADILAAHRQNLLAIMIHNPENVDALAMHLQATHVRRGRIDPRSLVLPDRLIHAIGRTGVPIDAIWGEFDRPHPDPELQRQVLHRFRTDLQFRVIPDAGHWVMYEGAEAFNQELEALLAARPRSST